MFRLKLIDRGIDKADIVLAFYHPEHRKLTDECDRMMDVRSHHRKPPKRDRI
ncbi:element excision factor XisI family protein [Roseofilum sp. BLCC_M91]|uniref:Element excision factor XisI family protein n=1 Tax=Roseofilum halophilum BLCC-M91 TaxID=3022259 RepID=A0ABT7BNG0_9CYAN|nr:element excision factor XisI family protein [Roseofilum halophilum]MDJ1180021.1 element excision factor XisI family protein [Roseofilum halophilum BLCC-M91]